jgi:beta-alanine degradation protein BauB
MKIQFRMSVSVLMAAVACLAATRAHAQDTTGTTSSIKVPASQIKFVGTGIKQHGGEIFAGQAYGNAQEGKHGTFLRFPAHWASLLHSHTSDYYAVVVRGVMANPLKGEGDLPLPVGSYWYQKGGEAHTTKCISKTECVAFLVSDGKFDAQVLEKE